MVPYNKKYPLLIVTVILLLVILTPAFMLQTRPIAAQDTTKYFFPLIMSDHQPLTSNSYYMITVDDTFLFDLGCELGARDLLEPDAQDSVAVLDFSYPVCGEDGSFGVELFGYGPVPLENVGAAVQNFGLGYYTCSGADTESNLIIGVGTNNKPTSCKTSADATAHGAAWSDLVSNINDSLLSNGLLHQVQAYGASDMELGWNTPAWTRDWITGFEQTGYNFLLHFGDAAGCPYEDNPDWPCAGDWTVEDVWYISWGAKSALPLPLIYLTNGVHAKQWAYLSQYSAREHGGRMDFTGVFTQWQACQQWGCNGTDNTPEEAYRQMMTELGKFPETKQELRWKTDIRWLLRDEISVTTTESITGTNITTPHPVEKKIASLQTALEQSTLSQLMKSSFTAKLGRYQTLAQKIEISRANAAPKDSLMPNRALRTSDPVFQTGTFPNGSIPGLPYGADIHYTWQTITDRGYLQVAVGASADDPAQGAVYITQTPLDKKSTIATLVLAPEGSGPLTKIEEFDGSVLIESENGWKFLLDPYSLLLQQILP